MAESRKQNRDESRNRSGSRADARLRGFPRAGAVRWARTASRSRPPPSAMSSKVGPPARITASRASSPLWLASTAWGGSMTDVGSTSFCRRAPNGSMAERTVTPSAQCLALPDELDDVTAAAIANPGMSAWAAYAERARLKAGETVLVNGATGTAGRLAVQIAKHLGAKKVIATGRNADALKSVAALGADVTIPLAESEAALEDRFKAQFAAGGGRRHRLSVGEERRASSDCRGHSLEGTPSPSDSFRSALRARRKSHCRAPCCDPQQSS